MLVDLDECFLNAGEFAEEVTFQGSSGVLYESGGPYEDGSPYNGGAAIRVMWDDAFALVSPLDGSTITTSPVAFAKASDVSGASRGDVIIRGGVTYYIMRLEPDGFGAVMLVLSRDEP